MSSSVKDKQRWAQALKRKRDAGAARELAPYLIDLKLLANRFELTPLEMSRVLKLSGWHKGPTLRSMGSGKLLGGRQKRLALRRKKLLAFLATYYMLLGEGTIERWKRRRRKVWKPR